LNETAGVNLIDEAWDRFINGNQEKTKLTTQLEDRAKIRWASYNDIDPTPPFDW